jgi:Serine dehydrogenase proteinase
MPIDLILHTPGGLVLAALQIAEAVKKHKGKVTVFVLILKKLMRPVPLPTSSRARGCWPSDLKMQRHVKKTDADAAQLELAFERIEKNILICFVSS